MADPKFAGRYVVDLSGVKLEESVSRKIEATIQSAVLQSLAEVRPEYDLRIRFPFPWPGIIINPDVLGLDELEKRIGGGFGL